MKKTIIALTFSMILSQAASANNYVILESPMIGLIDGKSYAIDGEVFGLLLKVRKDIREILYGRKDGTGAFVGLYEMDGELFSITELSLIEKQFEKTYEEKQAYIEDKLELEELEHQYQIEKNKLYETVEYVKEEFLEVVAQYIDGIQSFKEHILILIKESCNKRGKDSCFLLKWGEEKPGEDGKMLRAEINTFKGIENFCIDLANFLEDMARSCPKGKALFIEMIKQKS